MAGASVWTAGGGRGGQGLGLRFAGSHDLLRSEYMPVEMWEIRQLAYDIWDVSWWGVDESWRCWISSFDILGSNGDV